MFVIGVLVACVVKQVYRDLTFDCALTVDDTWGVVVEARIAGSTFIDHLMPKYSIRANRQAFIQRIEPGMLDIHI